MACDLTISGILHAAKGLSTRVRFQDRKLPALRGDRLRGAEFVDEVGGALRVRGGGKDRATVTLHDLQPMPNVGGMILAGLKRQFKIGTKESCSQFGATAATDASCDTADAAINCSQVIPEIFRCTVVYGAKITSS